METKPINTKITILTNLLNNETKKEQHKTQPSFMDSRTTKKKRKSS